MAKPKTLKPQPRRVKLFAISIEAAGCVYRQGLTFRVEKDGLPDGAKVIGAYIDQETPSLMLLVESETFPLVLDGKVLEIMPPCTMREITGTEN